MDLLSDVLSAVPELIYVADLDTYELLYMNDPGIEKFCSEYKGKKCYQVLQNRNTPCEFCTNHLLQSDRFYSWEFFNQKVGKNYLLKDKLITWENKLARVEIAFDTTEFSKEKMEMRNLLNRERLLLNCITNSIKMMT